MNIKLIERDTQVLSGITGSVTFKISESSFLYMRMDVEGLAVQPKTDDGKPHSQQEDPKPIRVEIPEGKTPVLCLNTGKAQFLNLNEKVEIVVLDVNEITLNKGE